MSDKYAQIDYPSVVTRLINDFGFKISNKHLYGGECPVCHKKELYSHVDKPYSIKCNRINKCDHEETINELYPDLFEHFTRKYPATESDPLLTAKTYLSISRGFDVSKLMGSFDQGFKYDAATNTSTATVKFCINKEENVYWERLIDYADVFGKKAHFLGKYSGLWWKPSDLVISENEPLYIVEGIFDCLALWFSGYQAVSIMACGNYPNRMLEEISSSQTLIFALDNNKAGIQYAKKHTARAKKEGFQAFMAIPENNKHDWNDLYKLKSSEQMDKVLEKALWNGAGHFVFSAVDKATLHVMQYQKPYEILQKNSEYWEVKYSKTSLEKTICGHSNPEDDDIKNHMDSHFYRPVLDLLRDSVFQSQIKSSIKMKNLSDGVLNFEYMEMNEYTQERAYHYQLKYANGAPDDSITLSGSASSSAGELQCALSNHANGLTFKGGKNHLEEIRTKHWFKKQLKIVKTIDFIGYDKKNNSYVFDNTAFINGKQVFRNEKDFFENKKIAIKSTLKLQEPVTVGNEFNPDEFTYHLQNSFKEKGLLVFAWWTGSLFAEQLRSKLGHYPFMEWCGQASSGKSTLIEILWKLFGRDHEGFNPFGSSWAAVTRELAQISNMPIVLMESDANDERGGNSKGFNWESLKPAHDGKPLRSRGVKNNGNETTASPFRGALMATQNNPVQGSEAIITRFIHIDWGTVDHNPTVGEESADFLRAKSCEELSGFLPMMLSKEKKFISSVIEKLPEYQSKIKAHGLKSPRIIKNHALLMSLLDTLSNILNFDGSLLQKAYEMCFAIAIERQKASQIDHPSVEEFWELYDYLNIAEEDMIRRTILNHSKNPQYIAINLVHFENVCKARGVNPPDKRELKRHLQGNKRYKYTNHKAVKSDITGKTVKCYIFETGK